MVEHERDPERKGEQTETKGAAETDPTLDIVRQLIVDAEAIPAPARRPPGPTTPRPDRPMPTPAPAPIGEPVAGRLPVQDAMPEAWDDAPDGDDWDDLALGGSVRPYGIVDPETGEVVALDGAGEAHEDPVAESGAPARVRKPWLGRLLGGALRSLATLAGRALRALAARVGAGLAAAERAITRFLRRPDAPRRLATALLVIFVIAWPWKVLWLTLLIPLAALITWASVGNEGCAELVVAWHGRLKARDPDKAERIRLRAAAASRALGRGLDRLPERWTQGLYLPDFEPEGYVPDTLKVDPFEELAARVHSAKRAGGH